MENRCPWADAQFENLGHLGGCGAWFDFAAGQRVEGLDKPMRPDRERPGSEQGTARLVVQLRLDHRSHQDGCVEYVHDPDCQD